MLVHLMHREHTLSFLGMQSHMQRGFQYQVHRMAHIKTDEKVTEPG
jgi:hypothetical protein